jgi:hypothetical protein
MPLRAVVFHRVQIAFESCHDNMELFPVVQGLPPFHRLGNSPWREDFQAINLTTELAWITCRRRLLACDGFSWTHRMLPEYTPRDHCTRSKLEELAFEFGTCDPRDHICDGTKKSRTLPNRRSRNQFPHSMPITQPFNQNISLIQAVDTVKKIFLHHLRVSALIFVPRKIFPDQKPKLPGSMERPYKSANSLRQI